MTITELPQVKPGDNIFNPIYTLWFYCTHCWERHDQKFLRDEGKYEVYECLNCHQENKKAVR